MILLRPSYYRYGVFLECYLKLQFNASWSIGYMVKLCHEKMLILRCILPPPKKKTEPPPEKKINLLPPGKSRKP